MLSDSSLRPRTAVRRTGDTCQENLPSTSKDRNVTSNVQTSVNQSASSNAAYESDDDVMRMTDVSKHIGQDKDSFGSLFLQKLFFFLSDRWRNWMIRFIFTFLMIGCFVLIILNGPLYLILLVLALQVKGFSEIINIGYAVYRVHNLPWFRSLSWYFLLSSNYFFYGESLSEYLSVIVSRNEIFILLDRYHRFISFLLYIIGVVTFVLSLVKGYYIRQFSLFAWTHIALCLMVVHAYLAIQNVFEGTIWLIVPALIVILNDVMAYFFGFFFGKTPLIKLSPKKTWEGYLGGGLSTILLSIFIAYSMMQYKSLICPVEYNLEGSTLSPSECVPKPIFQLQPYQAPRFMDHIFKGVGYEDTKLWIYPFLIDVVIIALFASVIGPFGGFFASGFKRAFKIKDFGDVIPGHGGIMDRFDCHIVMISFVNVYIHSFIKSATSSKLLYQIMRLDTEQQISIYNDLRNSFVQRNVSFS